jgi:hypothetical protein
MTTIKERIRGDLTAAMKSGDAAAVATLRMALAAITKEEVAGKSARQLSDDEVIGVLTGEVKKRREAAAAFLSADRADRADAENSEAAVLSRYLPQPLSPDEVGALVAAAVADVEAAGLTGGRAMGAVMKALKQQTHGRVDGGELAATVRQQLGLG